MVCTFKAKETAHFILFWFIKPADKGAKGISSLQKNLGELTDFPFIELVIVACYLYAVLI